MTSPGVTDLREKGQRDASRLRGGGATARTVGKKAARGAGRGAKAAGGRVSLATRVGIHDLLSQPRRAFWVFGKRRKRRFLNTLLFGTRGPKGVPRRSQTPRSFTIRIGAPQQVPSKAAQRKGGRVSSATQKRHGGKFAGTPAGAKAAKRGGR